VPSPAGNGHEWRTKGYTYKYAIEFANLYSPASAS